MSPNDSVRSLIKIFLQVKLLSHYVYVHLTWCVALTHCNSMCCSFLNCFNPVILCPTIAFCRKPDMKNRLLGEKKNAVYFTLQTLVKICFSKFSCKKAEKGEKQFCLSIFTIYPISSVTDLGSLTECYFTFNYKDHWD